MKKIISLVLAMLMLGALFTPAFAADYAAYSDIPVIYCQGQGCTILDGNGERLYPVNTPDGYIMDAVKDCLPDLINALKDDTDENWNIYRDKLLSYVAPLYENLVLDGNGEPQNGSHAAWNYSEWDMYCKAVANAGKYGIGDYVFQMDWRLDPFTVAEQLHTYIATVKKVTGASKVNAVFRCEANGIMGAYYSKYGYDDFNCVEMYVSSLYGIDALSAVFSGNFSFNSDAIMRFLDGYEENLKAGIANDELTEFLYDTLYMLKETYTLDGALILLTPVIKKIYQKAIAPAVLASYGTFPGIWTLVCADEYDDAKKWIFNGVEDEYAGLIAKLDNYHNNVSLKLDDLLENAEKAGVKTAVYAKYGEFYCIPLADTSNEITDTGVTVTSASNGATTANYTSVLSDSYIKNAKSKGTDKYISPDRKIDASTCIFKDTTWFIFNSKHEDFPDSIDRFMMNFFATNGTLTVFDDPDCPQYLYCSDEASGCVLSPLTAENGFQTVENSISSESIKDKVKTFVNALITLIRKFLVKLFRGEIDLSFLN